MVNTYGRQREEFRPDRVDARNFRRTSTRLILDLWLNPDDYWLVEERVAEYELILAPCPV